MVFVSPITILVGEVVAAAGHESRLLPHLRLGGMIPTVLSDGNPDAYDAACNDSLPAPQGHHDYRHPRSGWPHVTPHLPTWLNPRWGVHRCIVRLPHYNPVVEAVAPARPNGRLPPHLRPVAVVPAVHANGDPDARDPVCDGKQHAPQGHPDYRHPRSCWTHAMPQMPSSLNPRGRVHRGGVRLPHHHSVGEAVDASEPDGRHPPHLRPVAAFPAVHPDRGSRCP